MLNENPFENLAERSCGFWFNVVPESVAGSSIMLCQNRLQKLEQRSTQFLTQTDQHFFLLQDSFLSRKGKKILTLSYFYS